MIEGGTLVTWSDTDRAEAEQLQHTLEAQFVLVRMHSDALNTTFVDLARSLQRVREKKYWSLWGYHSWTSYISTFHHRVRRSQLFNYVGVLDALESQVSAEDLSKMGIA